MEFYGRVGGGKESTRFRTLRERHHRVHIVDESKGGVSKRVSVSTP